MVSSLSKRALARTWHALPGNTRGAMWILFAALLATTMFMIVKVLAPHIHIAQITFFRAVVGLALMVPFLVRTHRHAFKTKRPFTIIATTLLGLSTLIMAFYAVSHMNLADAIALGFVRPLFLIVLAVLFLSEIVRLRRWTATAVGFLGVVVMLRPTGDIEPAAFVALFAAFTAACTVTLMKRLSETESPATLLVYYTVIATVIMAVPAALTWQTPSWIELGLLVVVGITGTLNYFSHVRGLREGEATAVTPMDYTRLLFAAMFGFAIFSEIPDLWMWVGAAMIVASTFYITRREAALGKAETKPPEPS